MSSVKKPIIAKSTDSELSVFLKTYAKNLPKPNFESVIIVPTDTPAKTAEKAASSASLDQGRIAKRKVDAKSIAIFPRMNPNTLADEEYSHFELPYDLYFDWAKNASKLVDEAKGGPEKFRFIKSNQYIAHELRGGNTNQEYEVCSCDYVEGEPACGDKCVLRNLTIECVEEHCPCFKQSGQCTNMRFSKEQYHPTQVEWKGKKGWGLVLTAPIKKGTFIMEYCGEILNEDQCHERLEGKYANDKHSYILTLANGEYIDATQKGSTARFINHSCDPNCEAQKWNVNGTYRIGIFAKRDSPAGMEVTFDYKFERFGAEKQRCLCGSSKCRGWLGAKPRDDETSSDDDEVVGPKVPTSAREQKKKELDNATVMDLQRKWEHDMLVYPPQKKRKTNKKKDENSILAGFNLAAVPTPEPVGNAPFVWLGRNVRHGRKARVVQLSKLLGDVFAPDALHTYAPGLIAEQAAIEKAREEKSKAKMEDEDSSSDSE